MTNKFLRNLLILLIVGAFSFGLGWWTNEMNRFAKGIVEDHKIIDSLKQMNPLFLNDTCLRELTDMKYHSPDFFTGGFFVITLQLNSNGNVYLIDSTTTLVEETNAGGKYCWNSDTTLTGKWCIQDSLIYCHFFAEKSVIEKEFFSNNFITIGLETRNFPVTIVFPVQTDTLYIREIPCILD